MKGDQLACWSADYQLGRSQVSNLAWKVLEFDIFTDDITDVSH